VKRLQVHLEDHQDIYYNEDDDLQEVLDQQKDTPLMGWFKLNINDPEARQYTYPEIPLHYTWRNHRWERRRARRNVITRMYFAHPRDRERFCLRLILLTATNKTSFEDLRTTTDPDDPNRQIVHDTFREAALALDLLDNDQEWSNLFREVVVDQMPYSLRHLFASVVAYCNPSNPLELWRRFANGLSEDYLRHLNGIHPARDIQNATDAKNAALSDIHKTLLQMGYSLRAYLKLLAEFTGEDIDQIFDFVEYPEEEPPVDNLANFNQRQRAAFDRIMQAVQGAPVPRKLFFIDGPGGTGKSYLYNTLIAHLHSLNLKSIAVASSGIAALILHQGRTAHSTFHIPLKVSDDMNCRIAPDDETAVTIANAAILIWDEAPMLNRRLFESVDRAFKDVLRSREPFGGKVVVFGGDFRQVTPVVQRGSKAQIENACLRFAEFWPQVEILKLTENMRVLQGPGNDAFVQYLLRIGEGREPSISKNGRDSYIRVQEQFVIHPIVPSVDSNTEKHFIWTIYPGIDNGPLSVETIASRVLLTPLNTNVQRLNDFATDIAPGNHVIYTAIDCIPDEESPDAGHYPPEFLNTMNPNGLPPFQLKLKVGQPIILIRNTNPSRGLCNGTRLIIRELGQRFLGAEIIVGAHKGHHTLIPRLPLTNNDDDLAHPIHFRRTQFPISPAYAITINKAQGQTLNYVGLYLPQPVFGHGQLYVALSRCTSPDHLKILIEMVP